MSRRAQRQAGPPDGTTPTPHATVDEPRLSVAETASAPERKRLREIGKALRWYDLPWLFLQRLQYSRAMGFLPAGWASAVRNSANALYQVHYVRELRHNPRESDLDMIHLPEGESVSIPGVWVVEYFTASGVQRLYKRIRAAGWDEPRFMGFDVGGVSTVLSSRSGEKKRTWWRIATLISRKTGRGGNGDVSRSRLPAGVYDVELLGVPIGQGVTAVVAGFRLEERVSDRLNDVLRAPHRARVIRRPKTKAVGQGPRPVLHYRTQKARARVHRRLRRWMRRTLPGAFARSRAAQPLIDLVFFAVADPYLDVPSSSRKENDALRGIGVNALSPYITHSDDLPGLVLEEPDRLSWAPDISENVWTLWGNKSAIPELSWGLGGVSLHGAAYRVGDTSTDFFARTGLTALLRLMRADASAAHDNARKLHGGASSRALKRLRERMLTTSLDLTTLEADVAEYNGRHWKSREPAFEMNLEKSFRERAMDEGQPAVEAFDRNADDRKVQKRLASELVQFDAGYREVLSTVASLGASMDSRRVQRIAVWVSAASLGVATVTLWVTSASLAEWVAAVSNWFAGLFA